MKNDSKQTTIMKTYFSSSFILLFGFSILNYWYYSKTYYTGNLIAIHKSMIAGTFEAPFQYRILIEYLAQWLNTFFHINIRYTYTLVDSISMAIFLGISYLAWCNSIKKRLPTKDLLTISTILFFSLGICAYYLLWFKDFHDPYTFFSLCYIALSVYAFSQFSTKKSIILYSIILITLSIIQSFNRADVVGAIGGGYFLYFLFFSDASNFRSKLPGLILSGMIASIAVITQLYLSKIVYPHATYGTTPLFMLPHNFDLRYLSTFIPLMLPYFFGLTLNHTYSTLLPKNDSSSGLLLGSFIYLLTWIIVGKINEPAIFLPFALSLSYITAIGVFLKLKN